MIREVDMKVHHRLILIDHVETGLRMQYGGIEAYLAILMRWTG